MKQETILFRTHHEETSNFIFMPHMPHGLNEGEIEGEGEGKEKMGGGR